MDAWYPEYVKFISEMRQREFRWGEDDCGIAWAARLVEIVTGERLDIDVPTYTSELGAVRALRKMGYNDLKEAAIDILKREPEPPSRATIGDLALIETGGALGYAFGIVNGERVFYRTIKGIGTKDLLEASCIFKL